MKAMVNIFLIDIFFIIILTVSLNPVVKISISCQIAREIENEFYLIS